MIRNYYTLCSRLAPIFVFPDTFRLRRVALVILECVPYMLDPNVAASYHDSNHIEAHLGEVRLRVGDESFGEGQDRPLFARGDGFERVTVSRAPAQLDLDEDQRLAIAQYEIYLPFAGTKVSLDETVSLLEQITQGQVFTPVPDSFRAQAPTPA